jgi:hypothetical protein
MSAVQAELPAFELLENLSQLIRVLVPALLFLGHGTVLLSRTKNPPEAIQAGFSCVATFEGRLGCVDEGGLSLVG